MSELMEQQRTVTLHLDISFESSIMIRDIKKGRRISREQVVEDAIQLLYEQFKTESSEPKADKKQIKTKVGVKI